jgi:hypothetical protein
MLIEINIHPHWQESKLSFYYFNYPRVRMAITSFFAGLLLLLAASNAMAQVSRLDGEWYSPKWKYGYRLKNGVGIATSTNSPNFKPGDEIIRIFHIEGNDFEGEQVYRDGRFYRIYLTPENDGRLFIRGEGNISWHMERIRRPSQERSDKTKENIAKAKCLLFEAARQSCASAGSYAQCMNIRWGQDWMAQERRCQ